MQVHRARQAQRERLDLRAQPERKEFRELQAQVESVEVDPALEGYAVALVTATRADPRAEVGASPRGSLARNSSQSALIRAASRESLRETVFL